MRPAGVAKACGVDPEWFEGWDGEFIGIYPLLSERAREGSGFRRRVRAADPDACAASRGVPRPWILDIGIREKRITSEEATRIRYALDVLGIEHYGRPPVRKVADT